MDCAPFTQGERKHSGGRRRGEKENSFKSQATGGDLSLNS